MSAEGYPSFPAALGKMSSLSKSRRPALATELLLVVMCISCEETDDGAAGIVFLQP